MIEITRDIMKFKDADGSYLLEKIRDTAGQVLPFMTHLLHKNIKRNSD